MSTKTDTPESAEDMKWANEAAFEISEHCENVRMDEWDNHDIAEIIRKHAQQSDTAAANAALSLKLQRCEEALRGMEALATGEGWNTPIFSAPFGAALREARATLTHPTRNEGEKKV